MPAMATVTFDTLKFVKQLEAAGVPSAHAEAQARAVAEAIGEVDVATKRDIEELRAATKRDLDALEARLTIKLGIWMALISSTMAGIIIAVLRLPH